MFDCSILDFSAPPITMVVYDNFPQLVWHMYFGNANE